jgi:hypothetical protein
VDLIGFGERWPADIRREFDAIPVVGREILELISGSANPELIGFLVDDIS